MTETKTEKNLRVAQLERVVLMKEIERLDNLRFKLGSELEQMHKHFKHWDVMNRKTFNKIIHLKGGK